MGNLIIEEGTYLHIRVLHKNIFCFVHVLHKNIFLANHQNDCFDGLSTRIIYEYSPPLIIKPAKQLC